MAKGKSEKTGSKGAKTSKAAKTDISAFGMNISTSDQLTVIHLLGSHDILVARHALENIHFYCSKDPKILMSFCEMGIWPHLNNFVEHADLLIVELTLDLIYKILSETTYPLILLDESKNIYNKLTNDFLKIDDAEIIVNCSSVMIKLMDMYPEIVSYIYNKLTVNRALHFLKSSPKNEVKENVMELISRFMIGAEQEKDLATLPNFQPNLLVCFVKDNGSPLQKTSINLLIKLCIYKEKTILETLYRTKVPHLLVNLLVDESYKLIWFDLIYICSLLLGVFENCAPFIETEEFPKLLGFIKYCTAEFELRYAELLGVFAKYHEPNYRQKLHTYGLETVVLMLFESNNDKVLKVVCDLMVELSDHNYALDYMINDASLTKLKHLLDKKEHGFPDAAVDTVCCFMKRNSGMIPKFHQNNGVSVIIDMLLNGYDKLEESTYKKIIDISEIYLTHSEHKDALMTEDIFLKLLNLYNIASDEIAIKVSFMLNDNFINKTCREKFTEADGCNILSHKLATTLNPELIKNTLVLMKTLVVYKKISKILLKSGAVHSVSKYKDEYYCANVILNSLYCLYMPMKFFNTEILDITDIINDNFYLIVGEWHDTFPLLEQLEYQKKCPNAIIYMVDYSYTNHMHEREKNKIEERINLSENSINIGEEPEKQKCRAQTVMINEGGLTEDPYLYDYFVELTETLSQEDDQSIPNKIKIVAKFVYEQMCGFLGFDALEPKHIFQIHINHLKQRLKTSVIPIGFLRMGYVAERALLFKVLADYFGVYTTLQKKDKLYWNEVPLLTENKKRDKAAVQQSVIYYVVDLFDDIGEIYKKSDRRCVDYFDDMNNLFVV